MFLEIRCLYLGQYHAKYQRNNKRCGFKNLRCFPYCGPNNIHHEQGFCGAPITMDVSVPEGTKNPAFQLERLRAWGEFALHDAPPRFPVGSVFTKADISPLLRTETERSNPLFESSLECCEESSCALSSGATMAATMAATSAANKFNIIDSEDGTVKRRFAFHSQKMGYHYGWVGNKHSSNQCHSFCTYVAAEIAPNKFQCVGVFHSSPFTIFCRRRHKTVPKEEKEQLAEPMKECIVRHQLDASGKLPTSNLPLNLSCSSLLRVASKKRKESSNTTTSEESDMYSESEGDSDDDASGKSASNKKSTSNKRSRLASDTSSRGSSPRGVASLGVTPVSVSPICTPTSTVCNSSADAFLEDVSARSFLAVLSCPLSSKPFLDISWMLRSTSALAPFVGPTEEELTEEDDQLLDEIIFESESSTRSTCIPSATSAEDRVLESLRARFVSSHTFPEHLESSLKAASFDSFIRLLHDRCRDCADLAIPRRALVALDERQLRNAFSSLIASFNESQTGLTAVSSCSVSPSSSYERDSDLLDEPPRVRTCSVDGFFSIGMNDGSLEEDLHMMNKLIDLTDLFGPSASGDEPLNDEVLLEL